MTREETVFADTTEEEGWQVGLCPPETLLKIRQVAAGLQVEADWGWLRGLKTEKPLQFLNLQREWEAEYKAQVLKFKDKQLASQAKEAKADLGEAKCLELVSKLLNEGSAMEVSE